MERRDFFKNAGVASLGLVGASLLTTESEANVEVEDKYDIEDLQLIYVWGVIDKDTYSFMKNDYYYYHKDMMFLYPNTIEPYMTSTNHMTQLKKWADGVIPLSKLDSLFAIYLDKRIQSHNIRTSVYELSIDILVPKHEAHKILDMLNKYEKMFLSIKGYVSAGFRYGINVSSETKPRTISFKPVFANSLSKVTHKQDETLLAKKLLK